MGYRASNLSDVDVNAAWILAIQTSDDPTERISIQGSKKISGAIGWEKCILMGPRWALEMIEGRNER